MSPGSAEAWTCRLADAMTHGHRCASWVAELSPSVDCELEDSKDSAWPPQGTVWARHTADTQENGYVG